MAHQNNSDTRLPNSCYTVLKSTGELVIIKQGETGYYSSSWDTGNYEKNSELAVTLNEKLGVSAAQKQAMEFGSMFGWDKPGANPEVYNKKPLDKQISDACDLLDSPVGSSSKDSPEQTL